MSALFLATEVTCLENLPWTLSVSMSRGRTSPLVPKQCVGTACAFLDSAQLPGDGVALASPAMSHL